MTEEEGITAEELGAVQSIVMAVSAGRVWLQVQDAEQRAERERDEPELDDPDGDCPPDCPCHD